jgi:hypothetical protein
MNYIVYAIRFTLVVIAFLMIIFLSWCAHAECLSSSRAVRSAHGANAWSTYTTVNGRRCYSLGVRPTYAKASLPLHRVASTRKEVVRHGANEITSSGEESRDGAALSDIAVPATRTVIDLLTEMGWVDYLVRLNKLVDIAHKRWISEAEIWDANDELQRSAASPR